MIATRNWKEPLLKAFERSILGNLGSKKEQGMIQGVSSSAGSLASIFGLIAGGVLYTILGAKTFLIGGAVFVIVFLYCLTSLKRIPVSERS